LNILDSVTSLGVGVFDSCSSLTSIHLPAGLTSIPQGTFGNCSSLNNPALPSSVTSIGDYAFRNCQGLTTIVIPPGVTSLGDEAFVDCHNLTSVNIPSGVSTLEGAFVGTGLTSITIPGGVTNIISGEFQSCPNLVNVCFQGNAPSTDGTVFRYDYALSVVYYINGTQGWQATFNNVPTSACSDCGVVIPPNPPVANIAKFRVGFDQMDLTAANGINDPITLRKDVSALSSAQSLLGGGMVADGVTPLLFIINGTPTNYFFGANFVNGSNPNGAFLNHLYVFDGSQWNQSTNITVPASGTAFAYLQGFNWNQFVPGTSPANEVDVNLTLNNGGQQITSASFGIRPVPVVLVHGIADSGSTWSTGFLNALYQNLPSDFVKTITYGVGSGNNNFGWPCTTEDFLPLAQEVDGELKGVEYTWSQNWAFTRYDAVGHSQGGVILRTLCQDGLVPGVDDVVSENNLFRGRFHKVVTIGAPHNGSTIITLYDKQPGLKNLYETWGGVMTALQKFDSDGDQIQLINNPNFPVDSRIPFNCVQTTIHGGQTADSDVTKNPLSYNLGLNAIIPAGLPHAGQTLGEVFIPNGSDGVVDFASQGGGPGTPRTYYSDKDIAHAHIDLPTIVEIFGVSLFNVPADHTQTASADVGAKVAALLSDPYANFGPFILPPAADPNGNIYGTWFPSTHQVPCITETPVGSNTYDFDFAIPVNYPAAGPITWTAQNYNTNGTSADGLTMLVNTNDSTQMVLTVDDGVTGQVVVSGIYNTTSGDIVSATPVVAVSSPPAVGANLNAIELEPSEVSLGVGNSVPTQIWGDYSNGSQVRLFTPPDQVVYGSSNTNVASANTNGVVTLNSQGSAVIQATYSGFSAQMQVSTASPMTPEMLFPVKTNGAFGFTLLSSRGITNVVMASTNLTTWSPLRTLLPTNSLTQFIDSDAITYPDRFYRVLIPSISTSITSPLAQ
jgi:pimeloyl-ACP methyl ester carboxylesterase